MAEKMNVQRWILSMGAASSTLYFFFVSYGWSILPVPNPELHRALLEGLLIGFKWLTFGSFISGLIQAFIWGGAFGGAFANTYNLLIKYKIF